MQRLSWLIGRFRGLLQDRTWNAVRVQRNPTSPGSKFYHSNRHPSGQFWLNNYEHETNRRSHEY
jgi:hypothetical protein